MFWLTLRSKLDKYSLETCYSRIVDALENQVISNYFIQVVMYNWI